MKAFLKRCLLFFLTVAVVAGVMYGFNTWLQQRDVYKVPKSVESLFIGDSHIKCTFDYSMIAHSINTAQTAEPYIMTYYKLLPIIENNPGIKNVILGFSYHNIAGENDTQFQNPSKVTSLYATYYPVINYKDVKVEHCSWQRYMKSVIKHKVLFNLMYTKNLIKRISGKGTPAYPYIGTYLRSTNKFHDNTKLRIPDHYYTADSTVSRPSEISKNYLLRIADFLQKKNIKLYLVTSPLHPHYQAGIPEFYRREFQDFRKQLEQYPNVIYLDYENDFKTDDYFKDSDHLNVKGAKIISMRLDSILNQ